ncbi:hypothetical protein ACJX0J_022165, partial [Zea mays]
IMHLLFLTGLLPSTSESFDFLSNNGAITQDLNEKEQIIPDQNRQFWCFKAVNNNTCFQQQQKCWTHTLTILPSAAQIKSGIFQSIPILLVSEDYIYYYQYVLHVTSLQIWAYIISYTHKWNISAYIQ